MTEAIQDLEQYVIGTGGPIGSQKVSTKSKNRERVWSKNRGPTPSVGSNQAIRTDIFQLSGAKRGE